MNTLDRITATTTDTSRCGLNRTTGKLATVAAFAAAAALLTATARAANVSEIAVSLNSSAYVKVAEGMLKDTLSLSGITAYNGMAQVDFVCVSNRPYATTTSAVSGLPAGSYVHQLSVFNNWDGSRTRSYRVQLAQPDGTTDIYARIPCVTVSQEGVNLVDYPDIRDFKDDSSKIAGSYTDDATIAGFPVTKLRLRRIDAPYIESDGTSGISTGYRMNGTSRLEVDFAIPDVSDTSEWNECRIFGTDNSTYEPTLQTCLYATYTASNGNKFFRLRAKTSSSSQFAKYRSGVDTDRHTAIFDLPNAKMVFMTDGVTNNFAFNDGGTDKTIDAGVSFTGQEATLPLSLFGRFNTAYATTFANRAKARIYGVRIYENDVPVHNFVPCLKDGAACFKDLVGGGFIIGENAAAFSADGDVPTYVDDGYVSTVANDNSFGGMLYFDTAYYVSRNTAVALDCALAANYTGSRLWHLFDSSGTRFGFNYNSANGLRYNAFGASSYATTFTTAFPAPTDDKDVRRTFFIDNYNGVAAVVTSGFTNQTATFTTSSAAQNANTMKLATAHDATVNGNNWAPLKIYGCKIWEAGVLVRDFVPYVDNGSAGLRDRLTGMFLPALRNSSDTTSSIAYGGAIEGEQDAYLASNGTTGLNTGYKMNGNSRLEVDFAIPDVSNTSEWNEGRIFGTDNNTYEPTLQTCLYATYTASNGNKFFRLRTKTSASSSQPTKFRSGVDTERHTAVFDLPNAKMVFMTGDVTNSYGYSDGGADKTINAGVNYSGLEATLPLSLFARFSNAAGTAFNNCSKARIYSVRIYESDALVHEFIPYSRGDVVGLYDTVTGNVISNGSSFTLGGIGQDHGQLKAYLKPGYETKVSYGKTVTLTAYAPGATSYRWLMDGEPVTGRTDGTFEVSWANGGVRAQNGYRHEYQAIAIYDDFYGVTRESEPTSIATVTSLPRALTIIVK